MADYLRTIAAALRSGRGAPAIWPVQTALETYATEVAAVRSDGLTRGVPATSPSVSSRWDFRWSRCDRI